MTSQQSVVILRGIGKELKTNENTKKQVALPAS